MNMKEQLAVQAMYNKPKPQVEEAPKRRGRPPKVKPDEAVADE